MVDDTGAGSVTAPAPVYEITALAGTSVVSSPDGAQVYESSTVEVLRTVDQAGRQIVEDGWWDGEHRVTTLTQTADGAVFSTTDDQGSFTGTLHFTGPAWTWIGWTYALTMADGSGTIDGTATLSELGLHADKRFIDETGQVVALIVDELDVVDPSDLTNGIERSDTTPSTLDPQ